MNDGHGRKCIGWLFFICTLIEEKKCVGLRISRLGRIFTVLSARQSFVKKCMKVFSKGFKTLQEYVRKIYPSKITIKFAIGQRMEL